MAHFPGPTVPLDGTPVNRTNFWNFMYAHVNNSKRGSQGRRETK
jgi:hypothetical protein